MESILGSTVQGLPGSGMGDPMSGLGQTESGGTEKAHFVHRDGQRFRTGQGTLGAFKEGEADMLVWEAPNGQRMLTFVVVPCPRCGYQRPIAATQMNTNKQPVTVAAATENGLTLRMRLQCPAHWEEVNEAGHATGRRVRCGFDGVIRDGHVHSIRCPCADFRQSHDGHTCQCGGKLTEAQKEQRQAELRSMRSGL